MTEIETNVIYCGDNLEIMRKMDSESIDLIYADPPFFSGRNYDVIWEGEGDHSEIRSFKDTEWYRVQCPKCDREVVKAENFCSACGASLEDAKVVSKNDIYSYIDWMVPRLKEMYRILSPTGSIYLHCDWHASAYLKIEMDRIFGIDNFKNEIARMSVFSHSDGKQFGRNHDTILFYTKCDIYTWNKQYQEYDESYIRKSYNKIEEGTGRRYQLVSMCARGKCIPKVICGKERTPPKGNMWTGKLGKSIEELESEGRIVISKNGIPRVIYYLDEMPGKVCQSIWTDVYDPQSQSKERLGYPTQKAESLLERIIKASSNPGDIVLDPFAGCATAMAVAKNLGRKWIGIDVSWRACKVIAERLKIPIHSIKNMPLKNADFAKMEPMEFQQWACDQMQANNVMPGGGADGGIDGIVRSNLLTTGCEGALLQVKHTKKDPKTHTVGVNTVKALFATMHGNRKKTGFIVALSFGKGAVEQVAKYKNEGSVDITLVKAEDIAERGYFK